MPRPAPDPLAPDKGRAVRGMFASIARRYDLLNRLLSLGLDQRWRAALVGRLPPLAAGERVLDLCTGTGDVAFALRQALPAHVVVLGADFCEEMVALAPGKQRPGGHPSWLVGDALALPFPDRSFGAVSVAFGLRNVQDTDGGLHEMARVLRPGGRLLVLEFSRPENRLFAPFYRLYLFRILPVVGRLLSGSRIDAYRYLPESVWAWPTPPELASRMAAAGLTVVEQRRFLGGTVVLHVAERGP